MIDDLTFPLKAINEIDLINISNARKDYFTKIFDFFSHLIFLLWIVNSKLVCSRFYNFYQYKKLMP